MLLLTAAALACESWGIPTQLNEIFHPDLVEASGLAASRREPGVVWTHNDSGKATLFRFSLTEGSEAYRVDGADNQDWEDIAAAPCPQMGDCLYVADTGVDRDLPGDMEVYVVREPRPGKTAVLAEVWNLSWPDGPRDAEALLVHPCTLDAWLITKGDVAEVYRIPANRGLRRRPVERVATVAVDRSITAAEFSPDGTALVLRSDGYIWRLPFDVDDPDAHWSDPPQLIAALADDGGERKGEGIAWEADGDLLLVDEGQPTPLGRLVCEDPAPPPVCTPQRGCGCQAPPGGPSTAGLALLALGALRRRRSGAAPAARAGSAGAGPPCAGS